MSKKDIVVFEDTYSCGTSIAISLPCIFSNLEKNFKAEDSKYYENLLDLAITVNYDVV